MNFFGMNNSDSGNSGNQGDQGNQGGQQGQQGDPNAGNQQPGNGEGNQNPNGNENFQNSNNFSSLNTDMWDNNSSGQQNEQQQQQQQQPASAFDDYVNGLSFADSLNLDQFFDENATPEERQQFSNNFDDMGKQIYKQAVGDMNKLFQAQMQQFKEEVMNESQEMNTYNAAEQALFEDVPVLAHKDTKPMAQMVLKQLMDSKGLPPAEAIAQTKKYFKAFTKEAMKDFEFGDIDSNFGQQNKRGGENFLGVLQGQS